MNSLLEAKSSPVLPRHTVGCAYFQSCHVHSEFWTTLADATGWSAAKQQRKRKKE